MWYTYAQQLHKQQVQTNINHPYKGEAMPIASDTPNSPYVVQEGPAMKSDLLRRWSPAMPNSEFTTTEQKLEALRLQNENNDGSDQQSMSGTESGRGQTLMRGQAQEGQHEIPNANNPSSFTLR